MNVCGTNSREIILKITSFELNHFVMVVAHRSQHSPHACQSFSLKYFLQIIQCIMPIRKFLLHLHSLFSSPIHCNVWRKSTGTTQIWRGSNEENEHRISGFRRKSRIYGLPFSDENCIWIKNVIQKCKRNRKCLKAILIYFLKPCHTYRHTDINRLSSLNFVNVISIDPKKNRKKSCQIQTHWRWRRWRWRYGKRKYCPKAIVLCSTTSFSPNENTDFENEKMHKKKRRQNNREKIGRTCMGLFEFENDTKKEL